VNDTTWYNEVVTRFVGEVAKHRVQGAGAIVDEDHFIRVRILVETGLWIWGIWPCHCDDAVRVEHQGNPGSQRCS